jgi:uncharacterized SAM-binding protein YcdF (DUF218 family)
LPEQAFALMADSTVYFVVFGAAVRPDGAPSGTLARRIAGAVALWRSQSGAMPGAMIVASGGQGRFGLPEAIVMKQQMIAAGVPDGAILTEDGSSDTLDSAVNCARIIRTRGDAVRVVICSSPYHAPRCWLLLRMLGLPAAIGAMPGDRPALGTGKWLFYVLREIVALPFDALMLLLRRRSAAA